DNITDVVADVLDEGAAAGTAATVVPEIVGSAALAGVTAAGDDAQTPTHLPVPSPGVDGDTVTGFVRGPAADDQGGTAPAAVSVLAGTVTQDCLADTLEQAVIASGSEDEQYQPDVRPDDEDEENDED